MTKRIIKKRIGEILLERGVINRSQLEKALAQQQAQGGLIGQILIELGFATEQEIALALTAQYGFPYLPLENYELDEGVMQLVPEPVARQYCLIAIDRIGNALTVAMADPSNIQAIEDLETLTSCVVQTFVSTPSDIQKAISRYYKGNANATGTNAEHNKAGSPNASPPASPSKAS